MIKKQIFRLFFLTFVLLSNSTHAETVSPDYGISSVPDWVSLNKIDLKKYKNNKKNGKNGVIFLQKETQIDARSDQAHYFTHNIYNITNHEGVDSIGSINLTIDPTYETLALHELVIIRNNIQLNRLDKKNIKIFQREENLDDSIYDGLNTIHLLVPDLQVGDILSLKYTTSGVNPALKGSFHYEHKGSSYYPIKHLRTRLLWPQNKPLFFKSIGSELKPQITVSKSYKEYVWDEQNHTPIPEEKRTPEWWLSSQNYIQISSHNNWKDISAWGHDVFKPFIQVNPAIQELADQIIKENSSKAEQMIAALKIVQQDIRYVSLSFGRGGYVPRSPNTTLKTRYGDCKDKSSLLVALLTALNIDAWPALVNTTTGKSLNKLLPSKTAFDHAIVKAQLGGKVFWLEGTLTYQRGDANNLYLPDYGFALVLSPNSNELEDMKSKPISDAPLESILEKYTITNLDQPGRLVVKTEYRGIEAMHMRQKLAGDKVKMQKNYLEYYSKRFPKIEVLRPLSVSDDEKTDTLTIIETYKLSNSWDWSKKDKKYYFFVSFNHLTSKLHKPGTLKRITPIKQTYPINSHYSAEIILPDAPLWWSKLKPKTKKLSNDFFTAYKKSFFVDNRWKVETRLKTSTDVIPATDAENYHKAIKKAEDLFYRDYINYNPSAIQELTVPDWQKPFSQLGDSFPYLMSFFGVWLGGYVCFRQYKNFTSDKHAFPVKLEINDITYHHLFKAKEKDIWDILISPEVIGNGFAVSHIKLESGPWGIEEEPWQTSHMVEGAEYSIRGSHMFDMPPFEYHYRIKKVVPYHKIVSYMPKQQTFSTPEGCKVQWDGNSEMSLVETTTLKETNDGTCVCFRYDIILHCDSNRLSKIKNHSSLLEQDRKKVCKFIEQKLQES